MTVDIDVNSFVPVENWARVREALAPLGIDVAADIAALERDGEVRLPWERNDVHVFFSTDALHGVMAAAARRVPFAGTTIPIISPEHLVVRKVTLDRPKDWIDIEQILLAAESLDITEIVDWLERLTGPDDPRVAKLWSLLAGLSIT